MIKRQLRRQILCLALLVFWIGADRQTFAAQTFYVNNTRVNLRSAPTAARDNILGTIERETPVEVILKRGSWFQVRLPDGRQGWVSRLVLISRGSPAAPEAPKQVESPEEQPEEKISRAGVTISGSKEDMIFISGGTAFIGSDDTDIQQLVKNEGISRDMLIDEMPRKSMPFQGFYIDRNEVTNADYKKFIDAVNYQPPLSWEDGNYPTGTGRLPVTFVSWDDAYAYAEWAGKRLPTAEEWEIASRGPQGHIYPWGESFTARNLNIARRQNGPAEVGTHADDISAYGVNDMGGNVMEWTASQYEGSKDFFVLKGGSWVGNTFEARGANRTPGEAVYQLSHIGFRCAGSVE